MTALVVRAQGVVFSRFCGEVSESHSTPSVLEIWVRPTEAPGGAEEAHRRWPEGRSEQGASKAKADPPKGFRLALRRRYWMTMPARRAAA
jgi:hypothetical protein